MRRGISRRALLQGGAIGLALATQVGSSASSGRAPNILFLLADDLRFDAVGYVNPNVHTPNLDRLAQDGVRFHNTFVTTSICCSSRASIFTGTYARRHNVWDFAAQLPQKLIENAYPSVLRSAGYRTGFFGKYGIADLDPKTGEIRVPLADRAGFDEVEDINGYYDPSDTSRAHHHNARMAEKAEAFINSTSSNQPFCLSISFQAPHAKDDGDPIMGDYVAEPDMFQLYARDIFTQGPTLSDAAFQSLPEFLRESESHRRWQRRFSTKELWLDSVKKYDALVSGIDRAIGRIMAALESRGIADNTVVVFASDNGYFLGDYGLSDKWYGYEASIRVPLMIRPLKRPSLQDIYATTLNIDFAPTILALAGAPIPATMQGRDLSPLWAAASPDAWRTDFLYEHYLSGLTTPSNTPDSFIPSSEGVRTDRYTYLRYPRQPGDNEQLFDRVSDPDELTNIIKSAPPDLVAQLRKRTNDLIAAAA